ncbi:acetyl-CoA carboxylase biotin carboxyl carrier protein [Novipirellula caenicola]|uniref:Biotin carboxyl carrier protein of acetyl-CoA carboxylase n=1 Tax=Novipirellula caenicola TaxID=1536901 RepID=A0ABP9VKK2_9BACT
MSKGGKQSSDIFDIDRLRMIVELMEEHELSEVDLQQGDEKIKLNRGSAAPVYMPAAAAPAPAAASAPAAAPAAAAPPASANTITIDAPMIGTFYSRANPESEPFVKVGQRVTEDTIVCIVEAMKVFNEIPAECSGTVVEILVNDQQPVDFGKPMFRIDPNA